MEEDDNVPMIERIPIEQDQMSDDEEKQSEQSLNFDDLEQMVDGKVNVKSKDGVNQIEKITSKLKPKKKHHNDDQVSDEENQ